VPEIQNVNVRNDQIQPAQQGFGAAEECYSRRFAPIDLLADQ
jgi:hypothetical protein